MTGSLRCDQKSRLKPELALAERTRCSLEIAGGGFGKEEENTIVDLGFLVGFNLGIINLGVLVWVFPFF